MGKHRMRRERAVLERWRRGPSRRQVRYRRLIATLALLPVVVMAAYGGYAVTVDLPAEPRPPQASVIYYSDGDTVLARVGVSNRTDVPLSAVPKPVRRAVLAAEDRGFYHHGGISYLGAARAAWNNLRGGSLQGASTITQQYVRNAFLTPDRTLRRKLDEAVLAHKVEARYGKDEILRRYLNTIYYGRGAYGIEAAAQAYFEKSVDKLDVAEGALLAAVIKNPTGYDPAVDRTAAIGRWRWVLRSMAEEGWLNRDRAANLRFPEVAAPDRRSRTLAGPLGLIVDQVEQELARNGVSPTQVRTGGLRIVSTIDVKAQRAALRSLSDHLADQPKRLRAALVAVQPGTGAVRAYYGGADGAGYFDYAAAQRPPASTFKPVAMVTGLAMGIAPDSIWDGSSPQLFPDRHGVPLRNRDDLQCRECSLSEAMALSLNTPFYALATKIGPERIADVAHRSGISRRYGGQPSLVDVKGEPEPGHTRADIAIGRYPVSPADLASVYATFGAYGLHAPRHIVSRARTATGDVIDLPRPKPKRAVDAQAVRGLTKPLLIAAIEAGVKSKRFDMDRLLVGKTGTQQWKSSDDNSDAWMAGYVPDLAAVVWVGSETPGPIRDSKGEPIAGDGLPVRIWQDFFDKAPEYEPVPYPGPGTPNPAGVPEANGKPGNRPGADPEAPQATWPPDDGPRERPDTPATDGTTDAPDGPGGVTPDKPTGT